MKIPCELDIEEGTDTRQARYKLSAAGNTILHKYEMELTSAERNVITQIYQSTAAHLDRTAKRLAGK